MFVRIDMLIDPAEVARRLRRAGDDEERIGRPARDRHVAFEAAACVQHAAVDDRADGDVDIVGAKTLQHCRRIASLENEFRK